MDLGMECGPGVWNVQKRRENDEGKEGKTGPFHMKAHLVRKTEKMLETLPDRGRSGSMCPHFQGLFLLQFES